MAKTSKNKGEDELRARLVRAAVKLLQKVPAQVLSLRQVARAVVVSQAAPYRHFKDKEALFAAIASEGFILLREQMQKAFEDESRPEIVFAKMGEGYLTFGQNHPEHLKLMFGPHVSPGPQTPELFRNAKLAFLCVVRLVQLCQKGGLIGAGDPFHRAMHIWMSVHGFTILYLDHRCDWLGLGPQTAQAAMKSFGVDLLHGLGQPLAHDASAPLSRIPIPLELLQAAGVEYKLTF